MRKSVLIIAALVLAIGVYKLARPFRPGKAKLSGASSRLGGAQAPGFSLQDVDGQQIDLANYRGKVVLLDFWATWCAPCRDEIPHFVELQDKYRGQGLQVIGISMDDGPKPVREFYREFKMNYPVALGTEQVAEAYGGVLGLPVTFVIDRDGRVAAKYTGVVEMNVVEEEIKSLLQAK